MPDLDLSSFLRPLALPLRLAKGAARVVGGALAAVASIAGSRLVDVQRLGREAWRLACGTSPAGRTSEPVARTASGAGRAAPPSPRADQARREIEARIAELAGASPWEARAKAARALAHCAAASVTPALVRALRDPSVEVALAAIETLSRRGDPAAASAFREVLANADGYFDPSVRAAAVVALARLLPADDFSPVLEAIRDVDADVSAAALGAIGERAPELAFDHAVPVLRDRSGYYLQPVRLAAALALERSGRLSAAAACELRESETDGAVRDVLERIAR